MVSVYSLGILSTHKASSVKAGRVRTDAPGSLPTEDRKEPRCSVAERNATLPGRVTILRTLRNWVQRQDRNDDY